MGSRVLPLERRAHVTEAQSPAEANADYENKKVQAARRVALSDLSTSREERQTFSTTAAMAAVTLEQQKAYLERATLNLERIAQTHIDAKGRKAAANAPSPPHGSRAIRGKSSPSCDSPSARLIASSGKARVKVVRPSLIHAETIAVLARGFEYGGHCNCSSRYRRRPMIDCD